MGVGRGKSSLWNWSARREGETAGLLCSPMEKGREVLERQDPEPVHLSDKGKLGKRKQPSLSSFRVQGERTNQVTVQFTQRGRGLQEWCRG